MWIKHCCFYLGRPALKGNAANLGEFTILWVGWRLNFIYLFAFGCTGSVTERAFLQLQRSGSYSLVVVRGLLIVVAPLVAEQRLWGVRASGALTRGLRSCDAWAVAHAQ